MADPRLDELGLEVETIKRAWALNDVPTSVWPLLDRLLASRSALAAQLAETQLERDELRDANYRDQLARCGLHSALTSAQAEIARLRKGIRQFRECRREYCLHSICSQVDDLLAPVSDASPRQEGD